MPHMWCRGKALHEDRLSIQIDMIDINLIQSWNEEQIVELYRAGGWWKDYMDSTQVNDLIRGSYIFAVAVDVSACRAVGMGRVISDGISDGYIQDLVVLEEWQNLGVGRMIVERLIEECRARKIAWVGLIAEPGKEDFYDSIGFRPMPGHVPMLLDWEARGC